MNSNGKNTQEKDPAERDKGPVVPAGTEQETGLTRGQTERPESLIEDDDSGEEMNIEQAD